MINMMLYDFRQKGSGRGLTLGNYRLSSSPKVTQHKGPRIWIQGMWSSSLGCSASSYTGPLKLQAGVSHGHLAMEPSWVCHLAQVDHSFPISEVRDFVDGQTCVIAFQEGIHEG